MAQVMFIEHNGERIDITNRVRIVETRCDLCGEFVDEDKVATATIQVAVRGQRPGIESLEGHAEHVGAAAAKIIADATHVPF